MWKKWLVLPFLFLGGCCSYRLFPPVVDLSRYQNQGEFTIAVMAVAKKQGGRFYSRNALEQELAEKLAAYVEEDVLNRKTRYVDLANYYKLPIPPHVKPVEFSFVDRQQIEAILQEQDFGQTDRVDPQTAARLGKTLGAKALLFLSCTLQVSGERQQQVYETKRVVYYENVRDPKTGTVKRVKRVKYVQVPKYIGHRRAVRISRLVRVKCHARLVDTSTAKVLYTKVTQSDTFEVYAVVQEGQRPRLDIKTAAEESLRSLGHKIGRVFYPIVARACLGATPTDPRRESDDPLYPDMTWD